MMENGAIFMLSTIIFAHSILCELKVRVGPHNSVLDEQENGLSPSQEELLGVYDLEVSANTTTDTITVDFEWPDGSRITQLTDYKLSTQITRIILLGEVELGQAPHQTYCFVSSFPGDIIPPEAVTKLRQKNPLTIRVAEEERGEFVQDSYLQIRSNPLQSALISPHLDTFCRYAKESVLSSEHELFNILGGRKSGLKVSDISVSAMQHSEHMPRCFSVDDLRHPCICSLRICFDWYPCTLKYCKNKDDDGEHRCGIKTCRKCLTFRFPTKEKHSCLWDEL